MTTVSLKNANIQNVFAEEEDTTHAICIRVSNGETWQIRVKLSQQLVEDFTEYLMKAVEDTNTKKSNVTSNQRQETAKSVVNVTLNQRQETANV